MDYIDCLFIGTNQMDAKAFRQFALEFAGDQHPTFRIFDQDFLKYKEDLWLLEDFYNHLIQSSEDLAKQNLTPLSVADDFNTAIAYLGTYLNRKGFSFDYVNCFREGKAQLTEKLKKNKYRTIALTTSLNLVPEPIQEIVQFIRSIDQETKIIVGGVYIDQLFTRHGKDVLPAILDVIGADYYVNSYQGEMTLAKFLTALKNNEAITSVPNLFYKKDDKYIETPIILEDNKLSDNMVDWSLFSNTLKNYVWIRTSISCKFNCSFCTYPVRGGKFQSADLDGIEYELDSLSQTNVKWLLFTDDTFNIPKERFHKILKMMLKKKYRFNWMSFYRCQFSDEETLAMMKESGCKVVFLGLESGNDQVLKNMNKGVTVDQYKAGMELIKKAGISIFGSFIIGFPGETEQSVEDTIKLANETDFFQPNVWMYSPEAPVSRRKDEFGLKVDSELDWAHNTMDSITATKLMTHVLTSVKESARLPMFETNGMVLFELYERGLSMEQVKQFIIQFNHGIKARLLGQENNGVIDNAVSEMRNIIRNRIGIKNGVFDPAYTTPKVA